MQSAKHCIKLTLYITFGQAVHFYVMPFTDIEKHMQLSLSNRVGMSNRVNPSLVSLSSCASLTEVNRAASE